jgi:hypothetical protein
VTESLPRTPGGKVDRRALMAVAEAAPVEEQEFVAARTPGEKLLAKIWCEVLEVDRVGVHDDFFALGGCSTHSMEVTVKAEAAGMPLTPEAVFVCSTIAELAAEYGRSANDDVNATEPEPISWQTLNRHLTSTSNSRRPLPHWQCPSFDSRPGTR